MTSAVPATPAPPAPAPGSSGRHPVVLLGSFFLSGFAALVYQVLWVRELGLLFGSTAQAAALTIAIFFTGLAWGGWFWGRRAPRLSSSLRWFGILEVGVAVTALGYFFLVDTYVALYPALFGVVGDSVALDTLAKAVVAATVLLPPAFLMGGTLPLMAEHLVRDPERLSTTGSTIYAVNTLGSAAGALAAGFVLPLALGFRGAYLLAVGIDLAVGIGAIGLARTAGHVRSASAPRERRDTVRSSGGAPSPPPRGRGLTVLTVPTGVIWVVAFASGFTTLGIEVVWTRLFSQVLQNSAYTYALVLATFLLALALGAALAGVLSRVRRVSPEVVLATLLMASGAVTAASPWLFFGRTDGLALLGPGLGFSAYVLAVVSVAVVVMLLPGIVLGAVLPYLLRTLQHRTQGAGDTIGRLVAVNTTGGILGSLAAGFVLLPLVGAWRSLWLLAATYPLLVAAVAMARAGGGMALPDPRRFALAGVAGLTAVALLVSTPSGLSVVRLRPGSAQSLVEVREGTQATVAVVRDREDLFIRVNNHYTLGGTRGLDAERNQSVIPLLSHPDPTSVFHLGMGTGITAGAGLAFPVERVVVCELIRDVVELAEAHFGPWIGGLFTDARAEIVAEDGRTCLARSDERYDLIISDLFVPWEAGTGNLYTLEHYTTARDRLLPGGRYVQWVPLYQASDNELGIIARTMDEVFDRVTVWRGDVFAERSIVALVGERDPRPLDPAVLVAQGRVLLGAPEADGLPDAFFEAVALRMYVGNLTASGLYADRAINTDTFPRIEYEAPRTQRAVRAGEAEFLVGAARERLYTDLHDAVPPEDDPYLVALDDAQLGYVHAGRSYSAHRWAVAEGRDDEAARWFDDFLARSPPDARGVGDLSPAGRLFPQRP